MTMVKTGTTEKIRFRLFHMPCCSHLLCWINHRLPNFCPECGTSVLLKLREHKEATRISDDDSWITYSTIN
jgi:DNA-directed RNA polymerase subunit RPC12/RpoP